MDVATPSSSPSVQATHGALQDAGAGASNQPMAESPVNGSLHMHMLIPANINVSNGANPLNNTNGNGSTVKKEPGVLTAAAVVKLET
jgi:hypothetical protein